MKSIAGLIVVLVTAISPVYSFQASAKPKFEGHWYAQPGQTAAVCSRECIITQSDKELIVTKPDQPPVVFRLDAPVTVSTTTRAPSWEGQTLVITATSKSGLGQPDVSVTRFSLKDGNLVIETSGQMLDGTKVLRAVTLTKTAPPARSGRGQRGSGNQSGAPGRGTP